MPISYETWREILKDERLPAVVVDLDAFDRNVKKLASFPQARAKTLRVASKSLRVPALIDRVLGSGGAYKGVMCYSAEEAEVLRARGVDDLLLAYPTVRGSDLAALRRVHESGARVAAIVDGPENVAALARAMQGCARPFGAVIDVDVSLRWLGGLVHLGVRRSPVRTAQDVARLLDEIGKHQSLRAVGVMAYEAQVAGLGDRNPFKRLMNPVFGVIRRLSRASVARTREEVARVFREKGVALELFNGGGTGTIDWASEEAVLTELSAGSGLLCSHLFDYYSNVQFEPACFFALQATRSSDAGYVTCQGGGYIASGEPGWDRVPRPYLPEGTKLVSMEGTGEVQTPVLLPPGVDVRLGDPILFRHAKAGELAERFNEYLLVSNGKTIERVKTYRGLGYSFY